MAGEVGIRKNKRTIAGEDDEITLQLKKVFSPYASSKEVGEGL